MSLKRRSRGVSLIELLLAVALVASSVAIISTIFPRAAATISNNRRRWVATNYAASKIQELKDRSYAYLEPTTPLLANFPVSNVDLTGAKGFCDCSRENLSRTEFINSVYSEGNVTYTCYVCINLLDRDGTGWTSYCPNDTVGPTGADKGLKNVRVRVQWGIPGSANPPQSIDLESVVTR
jgi:prepilin-type N-terminal cleavage/methylation domain-containing protein